MLTTDEKRYIELVLTTELKYADTLEDRHYIEEVIVHLMTDEKEV